MEKHTINFGMMKAPLLVISLSTIDLLYFCIIFKDFLLAENIIFVCKFKVTTKSITCQLDLLHHYSSIGFYS